MSGPPRSVEPWLARDGIAHGFFGRRGGVSTGIFESLNCGLGSSDDRANVAVNRERVAKALGADAKLVTLYQIHSSKVEVVTEPWQAAANPQADSMVTKIAGIALGILAADCVPVLLADPKIRVIGAAHAGWRGAFGGVLESTLDAMESLGARRGEIVAAVGPSISRPSYEVGPEFHERFIAAEERNHQFFSPSAKADHFLFDLPAYVVSRLGRAGVGAIAVSGECTYRQAADYFSYRRSVHSGEKDYGRNVSAILLQP
ncbi:MAG: peptidoglycan editing factor PgeF [Alphaproteobacteria bacterium]